MKNFSSQHRTFLLRVWRSNSKWRTSLEDPLSGERNSFSKLEALVEFLRNSISPPALSEEEDFAPSSASSQRLPQPPIS